MFGFTFDVAPRHDGSVGSTRTSPVWPHSRSPPGYPRAQGPDEEVVRAHGLAAGHLGLLETCVWVPGYVATSSSDHRLELSTVGIQDRRDVRMIQSTCSLGRPRRKRLNWCWATQSVTHSFGVFFRFWVSQLWHLERRHSRKNRG